MKVTPQLHKSLYISVDDIEPVSLALRSNGFGYIADQFDGAVLHTTVLSWSSFVGADWSQWDIAEYDHDIRCREILQVAIEFSCYKTSTSIQTTIDPYDTIFQSKMRPKRNSIGKRFWNTHTIHPEN